MATLFIVGTPIGNLEDITVRALKVLNAVDLILCEDTRVTKKLLAKHGINKPTLSYHTHSKLQRIKEIMDLLIKSGKNLALVSDAGMPGISDAGSELVSIIRRENIEIESVPGPSALTTALSVAGVPCADFTFLGFLPHKKGRKTIFQEIADSGRAMIFYESPHRLMKTLQSLQDQNLEQKRVTVCKELTKIFEEVVSGNANEVKEFFERHQDKIKGEFVVIVSK